MKRARTSTCSAASLASLSQPELMGFGPSSSSKSTRDAETSSPKRGLEYPSGMTSELSIGTWASPRKTDGKQGHNYTQDMTGKDLAKDLNLAAWPTPEKAIADGGHHSRSKDRKDELLLGGLVSKSGFCPQAFPANLPLALENSEERTMTAGSGIRLCASLQPSDPLGPFLKTLLESKTFSSMEFSLKWTAKAIPRQRWERWFTAMDEAFSVKRWMLSKRKDTASKHSVFQLAPSVRRTDASDTGLFAGSWGTPANADRQGTTGGGQGKSLRTDLSKATWPTPRCEDSETTGAHRGNPDTLTSAAKAAWATPKATEAGPDLAKSTRSKTGLALQAQLHPWGTPQSASENPAAHNQINGEWYFPARGTISSGCLARTEKFAVRLIILSCWLQGYPLKYLLNWSKRTARSLVRSATQSSTK